MSDHSMAPWPCFSQEEADAVQRVLLSNRVNYWTGNECRAFEEEFARFAGARHAVAVANGTLALELALRGLQIGEGDEVIVTSRTFLASASCIVAVGATPVFADVDVASQNITAETIAPHISSRTRAIICVHLAGWPCDMDPISALAQDHDLWLIEDCAQAHGARYRGRSVGALGHVAAWSFCQDKIMTTGGEGGMVTTCDHALWSRMWSYKDHGKSWDAVHRADHPPGFRWLHQSFGSNYRLTEMQAAIGRIQLERMPAWSAARAANAGALAQICGQHACVHVPQVPSDLQHAYYKFYAFVREEALRPGWDRDRIVAEIVQRGVPCFQGSCSEVYLEGAFDRRFRPAQRLPVARELGQTSLMMLVHPTLTAADIDRSCEVLNEVLGLAGR